MLRPFASVPAVAAHTGDLPEGAAQAPYSSYTNNKRSPLQRFISSHGACYIQNGGILTPPAYGTLGDASRGLFSGPHYQDVDLALEKFWHFKERYSAQLRIEGYNVFNHVNSAQFSNATGNPANADPSGAAGSRSKRFRLPHHRAGRRELKPAIPVRFEAHVLADLDQRQALCFAY